MNHSPDEQQGSVQDSKDIESECGKKDPQPDTDPILDDSIKQEQYRREYLRQIRLRSCPGCGDDEIV